MEQVALERAHDALEVLIALLGEEQLDRLVMSLPESLERAAFDPIQAAYTVHDQISSVSYDSNVPGVVHGKTLLVGTCVLGETYVKPGKISRQCNKIQFQSGEGAIRRGLLDGFLQDSAENGPFLRVTP